MSSARATLNWPPASLFGTPLRRAIAEDPNNKSTRKDSIMEIAPTSYLRVSGASIVDGSGMLVRLQGPCLGGWMNMENFITGYPASETLQRRALLKAMGPESYEAFFDQFLTDFFSRVRCRLPCRPRHQRNARPDQLPPFRIRRTAEGSYRSGPQTAGPGRGHPGGLWHLFDHRPARGSWIPKPPLALRQPNALAAVLGVRGL